MDKDNQVKQCGCKGIRTCLLCENPSVISNSQDSEDCKVYRYCPHCDLCWPLEDKQLGPLYVGSVKVLLDFINDQEEDEIVSGIDKIEWIPSQSGRRKQDFGPKVNFKKKKGRIGDFRGFPSFSEVLVKRFQNYSELSDFKPVELCNLEYTPERGSAIEPHMDDAWIWGERLITVNLLSTTILTLTPSTTNDCDCIMQMEKIHKQYGCYSNHVCSKSNCNSLNSSTEIEGGLRGLHLGVTLDKEDIVIEKNLSFPFGRETKLSSVSINGMCSLYRSMNPKIKVEVQIILPPKSVLVLSGCCRHNWFHSIKREDVVRRRLAMTFRELASDFLEGGSEVKLGNELLETAEIFCDF